MTKFSFISSNAAMYGSGAITTTITMPNVQLHNRMQIRFLNPADYESVKGLCEECFPVWYPEQWYRQITSDASLYALAATLEGKIIGLIVARLKPAKHLNKEDSDILCDSQIQCTTAYILSLGVCMTQRRQGIASLLLSSLLNHLSVQQCKAVFLHVLTTNEAALHFYEKHQFRVHKFLPYYYSIEGKPKDGFTYVLYLNGGHGPWGLQEYVNYFCQTIMFEWCTLPLWCFSQLRRMVQTAATSAIR